ncbi:hypothetical protein ACO0LF_22100 [Undibacterium sp. Di27W]|uniref:hypothetical protein n=1 Tax=Undibacterium sp. Di27W TaxID=3413036 RepID=UPI003BEFFE4C
MQINPIKSNHSSNKNLALYTLVTCNIAVLFFFIVNVIFNHAPLLSFWLPTCALFILNGYSGVDEYKKLDALTMIKERASWKLGMLFQVLAVFVLLTKVWEKTPPGITDAFILALLFNNTKDYIVDLLATHKFGSVSGNK